MVLSKFVLKYIFVKLQDLEKETEFIFKGYSTAPLSLSRFTRSEIPI